MTEDENNSYLEIVGSWLMSLGFTPDDIRVMTEDLTVDHLKETASWL